MRAALQKAWEALPRPVQDALAMTVDRVTRAPYPELPIADPDADVRLFIAPVNYAGQAYQWSRAAERNPRTSGRNGGYAETNPFGYPIDYPVRWRTMTHSRRWQREQLDALATRFTHVIVEAAMPVLGGRHGGDVLAQIRELQGRGLKIAMLAHGTDARLPSRHREQVPWSPFVDDSWVPVDVHEEEVRKNLDLMEAVGGPVFVSTPGLLVDLPTAHLLPIVVDPDPWRSDLEPLTREVPRVVHVPSNPLIKGTAEIREAMNRLHEEGLIEYAELGNRTHAEMPAAFGEADIVLDQFRIGDYGVGSCEAMASGRVVVSHVTDQARGVVAQRMGVDLPIVEADLETLEDVVRGIVADRDRYRAVARRGPEFVRRVHDGEMSRAVLEREFLYL